MYALYTGLFGLFIGNATIFRRKPLPLILKRNDMEKRLTKSQLMSKMAETWGVSKKEAAEMYDAFVEMLYGEIRRAGEVMLPGLGKFAKKHRKARMGRNPATGESIQIPAKTVMKFSVNKAAKDALL